MRWLNKFVLRGLQRLGSGSRDPQHLLTGKRGELEAYLHLRSLGYRIIAANIRLPFDRGEIDLIGWDGAILCFLEVKTRSNADFASPAAAVDRAKQRHIRSVAHRYLQRIPGDRKPRCRFDIVSVVLPSGGGEPEITLHKDAFSWEAPPPRDHRYRDWHDAAYRRAPRR